MKPSQSQASKLAQHARSEGGGRDLGGCMRPAFHAPQEVWDKIRIRYPDIDDPKVFVKWYNSTASEYYDRFKTRSRI